MSYQSGLAAWVVMAADKSKPARRVFFINIEFVLCCARNWPGGETRAWRYRQGYPDKIFLISCSR